MSNQVERLAAALADRYAIERELGQGGMDSNAEASARRFATRAQARRGRVFQAASARRGAKLALERRNTPRASP